MKLCLLYFHGSCLAIETSYVVESVRNPQVTRVPLTPKSLMGLINLRGNIFPVFSATSLFLKAKSAQKAAIKGERWEELCLVLKVAESFLGVLVDRVDLQTLAETSSEPQKISAESSFIEFGQLFEQRLFEGGRQISIVKIPVLAQYLKKNLASRALREAR